MKAILLLTLVFAMIGATCVACLVLIGVYEAPEALSFLIKLTGIIVLLGASSCVIALIVGGRSSDSN